MAKSIITSKPFERVQTDTIDSSKFSTSFSYTLTMIDTFSKKLWTRPLKNHTADETLSKMKDIFDSMPTKVRIVQSDNGTEFAGINVAFPDIKIIKSSPHLPQSNGMIERVHAFLKKYVGFAEKAKKTGICEAT